MYQNAVWSLYIYKCSTGRRGFPPRRLGDYRLHNKEYWLLYSIYVVGGVYFGGIGMWIYIKSLIYILYTEGYRTILIFKNN